MNDKSQCFKNIIVEFLMFHNQWPKTFFLTNVFKNVLLLILVDFLNKDKLHFK